MLLHKGVPIHTISRLLGHNSPTVTLNVYSHILPGMDTEASKMIDDLIMPIPLQLEKSIVS
jgi:integrase